MLGKKNTSILYPFRLTMFPITLRVKKKHNRGYNVLKFSMLYNLNKNNKKKKTKKLTKH